MFEEIKELLQIMGIPYVESPAEAEAQCAFLEMNNLVDGIITEDSDVFLFGGRNIYRSFFHQNIHAQYYNLDNIGREIGLNREKLIFLALFLGSDYTLGELN